LPLIRTTTHKATGEWDIFTLSSDDAAMRGIVFGCTNMSEGGYGLGSSLVGVGLGRGPLSLVSQLEVGAFSTASFTMQWYLKDKSFPFRR
jgi:hypothetical protein